MRAILEPITAVLRVGEELERFGDPYEFSCTVVIDKSHALIKGAAGTYSKATRIAIEDELRYHGITTIEWERGRHKRKKVEI